MRDDAVLLSSKEVAYRKLRKTEPLVMHLELMTCALPVASLLANISDARLRVHELQPFFTRERWSTVGDVASQKRSDVQMRAPQVQMYVASLPGCHSLLFTHVVVDALSTLYAQLRSSAKRLLPRDDLDGEESKDDRESPDHKRIKVESGDCKAET